MRKYVAKCCASFEAPLRGAPNKKQSLSCRGGLGLGWVEIDGVSEAFELAHESLCVGFAGTIVKVIGTEIDVEGSVFEHVIDRREDGGGDGTDRLLRTAAAPQAQELGLQIAGLLAAGGPGGIGPGRS